MGGQTDKTERWRHKHYANHPGSSRAKLGTGIFGAEYDARTQRMEDGNRAFISAMWQRHHRIMLVAEACGRQVARV